MRALFPFFLLTAFLPALAQSTLPNSPARAAAASPEVTLTELKSANGLNAGTPNPWHLKAHFELQSTDRKKVLTGTFEEWWSGHEQSKKSWTVDGKESSLYRDSSGSYLEGAEPPIALQLFLPKLFLKPVPLYAPGKELTFAEPTSGDAKLRCIRPDERPTSVVTPTSVCFEKQRPILRWVTNSSLRQVFNQVFLFDGRYLAQEIDVVGDQGKILSIRLDAIEPLASWKADLFLPPAGASQVHVLAPEYEIPAPKILRRPHLVFPPLIAHEGIHGTVVAGAVIDVSGSPRWVEAIASPSSVLTEVCLTALRQSKFQPPLDHQAPVETIVINTCSIYGGP